MKRMLRRRLVLVMGLMLPMLVLAKTQAWTLSSYFKVTLAPENGQYLIGNYHNWYITLTDQQGNAVSNAQISLTGGMEGHGHGMPSQPIVTQYLGQGRYLVEGMLFNMAGEWTILLGIQTPNATDKIRFDIMLDF